MQLRAERKQCGRNLREEYNRQIEEKAKRVEAERQALLSTETQGIIDNQLVMRQIKEHEENRIKTQKKDNFAAWTAQKNHREFINSLTEGVATRMPL